MKVVGFNLTKLAASRVNVLKRPVINTNVEFVDVDLEKVDILKEGEIARVAFKHDLVYADPDNKKKNLGEINFEGHVVLAINKEESKNISKAWKKKELPDSMKLPLVNLVLKRCTPKAINLQDQIELPSHVPMPKIGPKR